MTDVYQVGSLTKRYPGAASAANDDITLTVHSGEVFGLLGPNGAGKTDLRVQGPSLEDVYLQLGGEDPLG